SGFLSLAGFESAGSLGEEADAPTRSLPRSLVAAVGVGAVFYVVCESVQTLGFGTGPAGVRAFAGSQAPLSDLATAYAGAGLADVLSLAAVASAIGSGLGCASVGAPMLYALVRHRWLTPSLTCGPGTG